MTRAHSLTALALLVGSTLLAAPAAAQTLARRPYLQMGGPSRVTIVWTTTTATDSVVQYGSSPGNLTQTATLTGTRAQHEVTLTGLTPATRYFYSVGNATTTMAGGDAEHTFITAPPVGTPAKFRSWVVGDSGTADANQTSVRDAFLGFVGAYRPQLYLHMGDMAYDTGTTAEFTARFFTIYQDQLRWMVTWPTLGNHEGASSDSATETGPYYTAYVLPRNAEIGGVASGTEAYYSFDHANVHFVVLDSHDTPRTTTGAMATWLQADLAATNQDWVVAFWHHPPYTKGSHDSDTESQLVQMRTVFLPILEAGGVDLVLGGHSHIYERSFLVDGAYDTPTTAGGHIVDPGDGKPLGDGPYVKQVGLNAHDGAVYVVAGHGGAGVSGAANHPLMYFSEVRYGSCVLDVQGNRLALVNIRNDGALTDHFTLVKGSALVLAEPDGGESLTPGQALDIQWASTGTTGADVRLEYSLDDGATWTVIVASTPNDGSYTWTVPGVSTTTGLVRVSSTTAAGIEDESNAGFTISLSSTAQVIPYGAGWSYHDAATDPGAATFMQPAFDDGAWAQGPAQLGYGDGDEATLLLDLSPNVPTAYFRRHFTVSGTVTAATLRVLHDDGVAVWVNGVEVFREYLTTTDHASYASGASGDNEVDTVVVPLTASPFVSGDNVIAAMVKQAGSTSTDLSFDLELTLTVDATGAGKTNGEPCQGGGECASGVCADQVCCDQGCGASGADCRACSVAAGASTDGTCGAVLAGAGVVCRPAVGACDAAERCAGADTCPTDEPASDSTSCDDGDACTGADACLAGACTGGPVIDCDDANECTADACGSGGCQHTPLDGVACTGGDCRGGVCLPSGAGGAGGSGGAAGSGGSAGGGVGGVSGAGGVGGVAGAGGAAGAAGSAGVGGTATGGSAGAGTGGSATAGTGGLATGGSAGAGTGGSTTTGGSAGTNPGVDAGAPPTDPASGDDGGCGCRVAERSDARGGAWLAVLFAATLRRRRWGRR